MNLKGLGLDFPPNLFDHKLSSLSPRSVPWGKAARRCAVIKRKYSGSCAHLLFSLAGIDIYQKQIFNLRVSLV